MVARRTARFPIGASVTVEQLAADPHSHLARLREREPVSWLPALDGWLVTRRDLALQVMRDPDTFTVDDPRFSTGRVVGRSMLTVDGAEHRRHRDPFARPFRRDAVLERFTPVVEAQVARLIDAIEPAGRAELRRGFAGPLAAGVVAAMLGLEPIGAQTVLGWYDAIVAGVSAIAAGGEPGAAATAASAELRAAIVETLEPAAGTSADTAPRASKADEPADHPCPSLVAAAASEAGGGLTPDEVASNAAVLLFGGIETTEGMIANALLYLLTHPEARAAVDADRRGLANAVEESHPDRGAVDDPGRTVLQNAIEESLRLEPAAAVIDRYATRSVELAGAPIRIGDLVSVSIPGANRDPAVFPDPDRFDPRRPNVRRHLAFAQGPHVCIGMHLARLEAEIAVARLLDRLPGLRMDPAHPAAPRGLVFRKPPSLQVVWD